MTKSTQLRTKSDGSQEIEKIFSPEFRNRLDEGGFTFVYTEA